jgi:predicted nucleic acid-binding protein
MPSLIVVVDTSVLFPATLRDTLLRAAEADLYCPRWSEDILEELRRGLVDKRGLTEEQAQHLLLQMRAAFPEATVTGYEYLIGGLANHPDDRHVLAAAVYVGAQFIVTSNLRDFPKDVLSTYDIVPESPDEFLSHLADLYPATMAQILIDQNAARKSPPEPLRQTLLRLQKSAPGFVGSMLNHPEIARRV